MKIKNGRGRLVTSNFLNFWKLLNNCQIVMFVLGYHGKRNELKERCVICKHQLVMILIILLVNISVSNERVPREPGLNEVDIKRYLSQLLVKYIDKASAFQWGLMNPQLTPSHRCGQICKLGKWKFLLLCKKPGRNISHCPEYAKQAEPRCWLICNDTAPPESVQLSDRFWIIANNMYLSGQDALTLEEFRMDITALREEVITAKKTKLENIKD